MITVQEANVHVYRTTGTSDEQASALKDVFTDQVALGVCVWCVCLSVCLSEYVCVCLPVLDSSSHTIKRKAINVLVLSYCGTHCR